MASPLLAGTGMLASRSLTLMRRNPGSIAGAVMFPLLFFALFMVVMKKIMAAQGFDYVQLLPSTIVIQSAFFTAMASAAWVAMDRTSAMGARLRAMPISPIAPFLARALADAVRSGLSVVVLLCVAVVFGMRFTAGWWLVFPYLGVAVLFAVAASMAMGIIGYFASSATAASSIASVPYLPLLMLSSGFAPAENFPAWLRPFVEHQPVTAAIDALRALAGDGDIVSTTVTSVVWSVGLIVLFGAIGIWKVGKQS